MATDTTDAPLSSSQDAHGTESLKYEPFQYTAIPATGWIRLLEILPGSGPLECLLRSVQLDEYQNSFDALSYVWGKDAHMRCVDIVCENQVISIGTNLACALEHIRHHTVSRLVWADAICINQNDTDERSLQVQQMAEIYSRARRVLIWIGDIAEDEAATGFDVMKRVNRLSKQLLASHGTVENIPTGSYDEEAFNVAFEAWDSIRHLMRASWFTRVWVVQEVGLARSAVLMCGRSEMDWVELVEFMMFVADRPDLAAHAGDVSAGMIWDIFDDIWRTFGNNESWRNELSHMASLAEVPSGQSFLDILNVLRPYHATDARDFIYALLGHPTARVHGAANTRFIDVDYNKTIAEVYTEVAAYTILHGRYPWTTLTSVDHCDDVPALTNQRLSWVPWWNEGWRVYWLGYPAMWYRAGGLTPDAFRAEVSPDNSLHLKVVLFDQISWTSERMTSSILMTERHQSADPIHKLWTELRGQSNVSKYGNASESETAFSLVIVAGRARDEGPADDDLAFHKSVYTSSRTHDAQDSTTDQENTIQRVQSLDLHVSSYRRNQVRALHNRKLFRTLTGYYGICHFSVRCGDICCVVPGANVPFVLRKTVQKIENSADRETYHLVGEAYIQGVMKGELLGTSTDGSSLVEQEIIIR